MEVVVLNCWVTETKADIAITTYPAEGKWQKTKRSMDNLWRL